MMEDSDEEDDDNELVVKMEEVDDKDEKTLLSPEDAKYQGELADGVGRIKASDPPLSPNGFWTNFCHSSSVSIRRNP
jgi:hypothetical protein